MKKFFFLLLSALCILAACPIPGQAASDAGDVKELNFVFLHGYNGHSCDLQLLQDSLAAQTPAYITNYEFGHSDIQIKVAALNRCYPNNVDIESWANNIADSIKEHFPDKKNLVLIGHSMGGKTALYAVSHNIGNLAEKVAMVVTINSPIKSLADNYYIGGDTALDYWGAQRLLSDRGILESLVNYDSSQDGQSVGSKKHWLAFISGESSPLSSQFDVRGIDPLPRVIDDAIVPISSQYADGADAVYYGEYGHGDFSQIEGVAGYMADQILRYIFGGNIECSTFARAGAFEHKAGIFPGTDYWQDAVGGVLADSGAITHKNESFFKWQEWEDVVGEFAPGTLRSSFQTAQQRSFPVLTGLQRADWASADDPTDGRLVIKTRAAPRSSVRVDWSIYLKGLLPEGIERDHYEVEIETGTQFSRIGQLAWETPDRRDVRLHISSQADSPLRWFRAQWRVYYKENRLRQIIDEFPVRPAAE